MTLNFYLDTNKNTKDVKTNWAYLREQGQSIYINTGEKINYSLWDKTSQRADPRKVKDNFKKSNLKSLNHYLNGFEAKVFDIIRSERLKDSKISFDSLGDKIKEAFNRKVVDFFDSYNEFLKSKVIEGASGEAIQKYSRTRDLLLEHSKLKKEKITFEKIDPKFINKFRHFLIAEKSGQKMVDNSANKIISFLKTFLFWAYSENLMDNKRFAEFKIKYQEKEIIALNERELEVLISYTPQNERLVKMKDLFLFQCFTGVRYSDLQNLKQEDIRENTWYLRTQKTKDILHIPLNSYSAAILAKYKESNEPLPVISNQKANKFVKELCEAAGIDTKLRLVSYQKGQRVEKTVPKYEVIGTHTARRTFVSVALARGMSPAVIMRITGHTTFRMMQKYLDMQDDFKREQMDKAFGSPLRKFKEN